ncbi:MAG: F0F1 ATP synthase subunit A [Proteobacteria bacterium]|nr:F0F1 ATP synthase subunit A [Pseudomonadota bacterium]
MPIERVFPHVVFELRGVEVRDSVVVTWILMALMSGAAWAVTRRLEPVPRGLQCALEAALEWIEAQIREVTVFKPALFLPLVGSLGLFLVVANSASLVPMVGAPTRDLNTTFALAGIVFVATHAYGLTLVGVKRYLRNYVEPSWILLPFNIIGELTRTLALALRLFGNMLSGELIVAILLVLAGLVVPVLMQLFGLLIAVIQAYVFALLALVYVAAGLEAEPAGGEQ